MGLIKIPNPCPDIMTYINERLGFLFQNRKLELPDFSNAESILSVSDYAGEDKKKIGKKHVDYQVLSFLILDWNNAGMWDLQRMAFRIKKLDCKRTIEYKKLNKDKERLRLLNEFLTLFNNINGVILTYLIHNDIKYLFTEKSPHTCLEEKGYGKWKPHIAEKILRVCNLQAPIIYKLTSPQHKFLWLTDRDSITNDMNKLGKIFQTTFNIYATHDFRLFAFANSNSFQDLTKRIDDLLSIPDLAAGSILEYFHEHELANKGIKNRFEIQEKANKILLWLSNNKSILKKITCIIQPNDNGNWNIEFRDFMKKDSEN